MRLPSCSGFQDPDIMVCFPQDMVSQQRENQGTDPAGLDPLNTGALKVSEFLSEVKGIPPAHGQVIGRGRGFDQTLIAIGKSVYVLVTRCCNML